MLSVVIVNDRKSSIQTMSVFFQYQNLKCKKNKYCMMYMKLLEVYLVIQLHCVLLSVKNGGGLCKCLLAFEVLSVQI